MNVPEFLRNIQIADAVDIVLVSILLYVLFLGLRRTRTMLVLGGLFILLLFYFAALSVGLRLTAYLFQGFFAIILIALIVLFQEEIRTFLERVAVWVLKRKLRRKVPEGPEDRTVGILVSTLADLSRNRIGALIVLPGKDELSRFIEGGQELEGILSEPLLKSLFDPGSIGHDGAVIVAEDRVRKFSCHLPLSTNEEAVGPRGTRHAAALGLSERSDALILVVSEERGTMSLARHGKLEEVEAGPLGVRVGEFLQEIRPLQKRGFIRDAVTRNFPLKVGAVVLASVLWFFLSHEAVIEARSFDVAIRWSQVPAGLTVSQTEPVRVILSGPRRTYYFLDAEDISITISLLGSDPGPREIRLTPTDIQIPPGTSFVSLVPEEIQIVLEKKE